MNASPVGQFIADILDSQDSFLGGIHRKSESFFALVAASSDWARLLNRKPDEIYAGIEPCIRQSVLMSLIPAKGLDMNYLGSIDAAVIEHVNALGLALTATQLAKLRNICLHFRKLQGMSGRDARNACASLAQLKARPALYDAIKARQGHRCVWCGGDFRDGKVKETLEHIAPKHLGDDLPDGSNWAIACSTCNSGKSDRLAWSSSPESHDYVSRTGFRGPTHITREHRWAVIMRDRQCLSCSSGPSTTELHIFRRISTGLPIPALCGTTCLICASAHKFELLVPDWSPEEVSRAKPAIP